MGHQAPGSPSHFVPSPDRVRQTAFLYASLSIMQHEGGRTPSRSFLAGSAISLPAALAWPIPPPPGAWAFFRSHMHIGPALPPTWVVACASTHPKHTVKPAVCLQITQTSRWRNP